MTEQQSNPEILFSTDKTLLDLDVINNFLLNAYWSKGRTKEQIKTAIDNSTCFGAYINGGQIGFARVLSDKISLAYLFDVFILEEFRGNGLGVKLMDYVIKYSDFANVKKWMLVTKDAHKLYEKFGFRGPQNTDKLMEMIPAQK